MTNLRLTGMTVAAAEALEPHVRALYDGQTARRLVVGEIEHVERTQPGPASGKTPTVVVRMSQLEIPTDKQSEHVRELLRALFTLRTATGTFDEVSGKVSLDDAAQKVATGASLAYVDDALQARSMLRITHKQLNALAAETTMDVLKIRRNIRKLVRLLEQFITQGSSVESLLPELMQVGTQLELADDDDQGDDDGEARDITEPRHDAAEALAGQDVGTRVPAPAFAEPAPEPAQ